MIGAKLFESGSGPDSGAAARAHGEKFARTIPMAAQISRFKPSSLADVTPRADRSVRLLRTPDTQTREFDDAASGGCRLSASPAAIC
jgi:hypothetical protein